MSAQSLLLYPFSALAIPEILFLEKFRPDWQIDSVLLPPAYYHIGQHVGAITNRMEITHKTAREEDFDRLISDKDGIIILPYPQTNDVHIQKTTQRFIETALKLNKKVFCATELCEQQLSQYTNSSNQFVYYAKNELLNGELQGLNPRSRYLQSFPFVVFVGGIIDNTYDLEVSLSLIYHLRKAGAKVSGITVGISGGLFNLHSVDFVNAQNKKPCSIDMMAKHLHDIVASVVIAESPDIIVVQLPDPLVKYSRTIPNGYGIMTYIYSTVIPPDLVVSSLPITHCQSNLKETVNNYLKRVYGYVIDCVFCSNYLIDMALSEQLNSMAALFSPFEEVEKKSNELEICNLLQSRQMEQYVQSIIKRYAK